jgi:hypothetical protein
MLWIGPPPTYSNAPPPKELEQMTAIARKYDVAERDASNRALGRAGEERLLAHERASLLIAGRPDLANRVRWVSHLDGDGAGYDIRSFDTAGGDRLIEVKTTNEWDRTPFHITRNELAVAEAYRADWRLMRLWNFAREPRAFELRPPLEAHVSLMARAIRQACCNGRWRLVILAAEEQQAAYSAIGTINASLASGSGFTPARRYR